MNGNRRQFLKWATVTAGAGASGALGSLLVARAARAEGAASAPAATFVPSCCNMCGGQTGILAKVVDGRVVKIEPNPHNPGGFTNIFSDYWENIEKQGAVVCPKGNAGMMSLYDPDRVRVPLRRTNPEKGIGVDPKWKEITWDEAFSEIASRLKGLRDAGEPHSLLWFSEDASFTNIQGDFCSLFGTPNYSMHSNLCDVARKASFKSVMGADRPLMDAIQSKYILLFGWNPLGATKWSHLPRIIGHAMQKGARLVVVDPYLSSTATKSHEWVPIRPGTDGAMALAMGHVIVRDQLYDRGFVEEWTVAFDKYAEYVKDKTPEWAEQITSVPAGTIERIAREFATTKPAVIDAWSGPGQHSNGVQGGQAIACLAALVGGYDRPGTLVLPVKGGAKHIDFAAPKIDKPRFDGLETYPMGHSSGVYTESINRLAEGKGPYKARMAMIVFQNPMMAIPGTQVVEKALKSLEFIVVNDTMMSETALMADIVVPGATYLERYDWQGHWVTWKVIGLRQPVVKPIFGQPTEAEFVCELGRRLGLKTEDGKDHFWEGHVSHQRVEDRTAWYEEYLSAEGLAGDAKMSLEDFKKLPGACWVSKDGTAYEKHRSAVKPSLVLEDKDVYDKPKEDATRKKVGIVDGENILDKPTAEGGQPIGKIVDGKPFYVKGDKTLLDKPASAKGKQIGTIIGGKPIKGFMTPSGKCEFVSGALTGKKDAWGRDINPLPVYEPRKWQPTAEYPLYMINWKESEHTHTRTQNNRYLSEIAPDNPLMINVEAAKKLGLADGDAVWVESPYGKVGAKVHVTQGIHPEVVGLRHGGGHWALGQAAKGKGTSDAALKPCLSDPIGGQALHKEICVRVKKA